ncbi:MAG: hypothetical protein WBA46_14340 [Thermomicrobiales bacterium]
MRVYLAGRFSRKDELGPVSQQLMHEGHVVTSRWLTGAHDWNGVPDEEIPEYAQAWFGRDDLDDIQAADAIVCFTEESGTGPARGGRHVEMGFALGLGKTVIACGPIENVFYALPEVIKCQSVAEVRRALYWLGMGADARYVIATIEEFRHGPTISDLVSRFRECDAVDV